jgi:hypothetical protein
MNEIFIQILFQVVFANVRYSLVSLAKSIFYFSVLRGVVVYATDSAGKFSGVTTILGPLAIFPGRASHN